MYLSRYTFLKTFIRDPNRDTSYQGPQASSRCISTFLGFFFSRTWRCAGQIQGMRDIYSVSDWLDPSCWLSLGCQRYLRCLRCLTIQIFNLSPPYASLAWRCSLVSDFSIQRLYCLLSMIFTGVGHRGFSNGRSNGRAKSTITIPVPNFPPSFPLLPRTYAPRKNCNYSTSQTVSLALFYLISCYRCVWSCVALISRSLLTDILSKGAY